MLNPESFRPPSESVPSPPSKETIQARYEAFWAAKHIEEHRNPNEALAAWERYVASMQGAADESMAHRIVARTLRSQGKEIEALQAEMKAIGVTEEKRQPALYVELAERLVEAGSLGRAIGCLERAEVMKPTRSIQLAIQRLKDRLGR